MPTAPRFDTEALIEQFSQASTRQGETLRKAAQEATLKVLQGRELTLKNVEGAVKQVTDAAAKGAGQNPLGPDEIARACVRGVEGDEFYVVPMRVGRWLWRLKRLAPEGIAQGGRFLERLVRSRVGGRP